MFDYVIQRKPVCITHGKEHFFGYYDKCAWNLSQKYILAHEISFGDRAPTENDTAVLGLIDLTSGNRFEPVAQTKAWCWQQGAMLQWHPTSPESQIIYNDRQNNQFVSVILDINSGKKRILPRPVAAVSHDGKKALSLNFSRLADQRPGYGYAGVPDLYANQNASDKDGLYLLDMDTGKFKLIISVAQMSNFDGLQQTNNLINWFNHLLFSHDDKRFIFLHRWRTNTPIPWTKIMSVHHLTRLYTANIDGTEICCLNDHDVTSHFDWNQNNQVLAFARRFGSTDKYYLFTDKSNIVKPFGEKKLTPFHDGHCNFSPDGKWILTDTYPNSNNQQFLILYNIEHDICINIGCYYSKVWDFAHLRCDLHPRWSRDGKYICFDSSLSGSRQIYILDVSEIISKVY